MRLRKEKTVITVETRRRTSLRLRRKKNVAWCEQCEQEVVMLAPNEASAHANTTARAIFRRVEAGEIHFLETSEGALLICQNSVESKL